jgi:hypothetical protein
MLLGSIVESAKETREFAGIRGSLVRRLCVFGVNGVPEHLCGMVLSCQGCRSCSRLSRDLHCHPRLAAVRAKAEGGSKLTRGKGLYMNINLLFTVEDRRCHSTFCTSRVITGTT